MGAGGVLLGNSLRMSSQQKTFAVAVSRDMAPRSRIVAYYLHNDEIVVDALNFFVYDTQLMTVCILNTKILLIYNFIENKDRL